jgi:hypothetical protein
MKKTRRRKWGALLAGGAVLPALGNCLPEDYFALSARNVAVALADSILAAAVSPVFDALGLPDGSQLVDDSADSADSGE